MNIFYVGMTNKTLGDTIYNDTLGIYQPIKLKYIIFCYNNVYY